MENTGINSDIIRGHIDTIILYSLSQSDKCAQQIEEYVKEKADNKYELNQATLYSSLKRLEGLKYIKSYWSDFEDGRRKFFSITEGGKDFVANNLQAWVKSREIINKLVDVPSAEPIYKTVTVYKDVVREVEVPTSYEKKEENIKNNSIISENQAQKNFENTDNSDKKDINFRSILNTLIKDTSQNQTDTDKVTTVTKTTEKQSLLSEELEKQSEIHPYITEMSAKKANNIDFNDLYNKAEKDGIKLRVSSKRKTYFKGAVLKNRLTFFSALALFLLLILEFLIFSVAYKNIIDFGVLNSILLVIAFAVFPIVSFIINVKNPKKTCADIGADSIAITAIIVFNLLLITVAVDLLFNLNFYDAYSVAFAFVFPITIYLDALCFMAVRYFLSKNFYFRIKEEK